MPKYLFREGVDVSTDINDIIITTPYATRSNPRNDKICRHRFNTWTTTKKPLREGLTNSRNRWMQRQCNLPSTDETRNQTTTLPRRRKGIQTLNICQHSPLPRRTRYHNPPSTHNVTTTRPSPLSTHPEAHIALHNESH